MKHYLVQNLQEVDLKQAYEWVKVGVWNRYLFIDWLKSKGVNHNRDLYFGQTLIHRANGYLVYEWIKSKRWSLSQFRTWLHTFSEQENGK